MKLDVAALRGIEREKDMPFETLVSAIETALLTAYTHTPGAQPHARVEIDRKTGDVAVIARELDADGALVREWDDTPEDFGRIATMTAKQVILQRLREVESEHTYGEYAGREVTLPLPESSSGWLSRRKRRDSCTWPIRRAWPPSTWPSRRPAIPCSKGTLKMSWR